MNDNWTDTPEYLALIQSAFTRLRAKGVQGIDEAFVIIGTPSKLFGSRKDSLVERTKKALPDTVELKALPQPMGAYCDYILDQSGIPVEELINGANGRPKSYGVIEGGHYSTDFLLMREGQYIERGADSCAGMSAAAEQLRRILGKHEIQASLVECEESFSTKFLFQFGEQINIEAKWPKLNSMWFRRLSLRVTRCFPMMLAHLMAFWLLVEVPRRSTGVLKRYGNTAFW